MIYQLKHTNSKSGLRGNRFFRTVVILLIVLVLAFGANFFIGRYFSGTFSYLFELGDYVYQDFALIPKKAGDQTSLAEENTKLKAEIEVLRSAVFDYELLKSENQKLYEEIKLKPANELVAAKIIARPPQLPPDSILLDRGLKDKVVIGDWVLASDRIVVGKILKVMEERSVVALNSFANTVSYGHLERTSELVEVVGDGGGSLIAKVPIDFDIKMNDRILIEGRHPYLLATVSLIKENTASGFKEVLLSLPINLSKIRIVFLEKTGQ
jgi:cell shape-determining protein MreC